MVSFSDALTFGWEEGRVGTGRGKTGTSGRKAIASWYLDVSRKARSAGGAPASSARSTSVHFYRERTVAGPDVGSKTT